eukprot:TRINITY_DN30097_c0_g1_i1.p1 TRINITY_DN30097_c0_g1~~TRINITY_DN30097_c0_g1_i1.p1  ORF type:complete len:344 (+),score=134.26 TRINITY_DN30097_c0_g1_i1:84-1034(+)
MDDEAELQASYAVAERVVGSVSKELRIPFLEVKLYQKFFLSMRDQKHLQATLLIVNTLLDHKRQTLKVLTLIKEREEVLAQLKNLAYKYASEQVSTLEAQSVVFQLLYGLQQSSLRVVEGILDWRKALTRPYGFVWHGQNYILKMIHDSQFLDASELSKVLPLQLSTHPLCSNLASLSLFGGGVAAKGRPGSAAYPLKKKYVANGVEDVARIQRAETAIYEEHGLQRRVLQELTHLSNDSAFITVLNLSAIIPNCGTGVKLTKKSWQTRYADSLRAALAKLDEPPPGAGPPSPRDDARPTWSSDHSSHDDPDEAWG